MASTIVLCFIAGVLAANATPHFVKGITREPFPTPFSPAPLPNLIGGWAMYVLAALLLLWGHVGQHPLAALIAGALGVLPMGMFHAAIGAFGKKPADASGAIPFEKPGRHRRVRLGDLLEYRRRQRSAAELALADMIADTERLGLYDTDPEDVQAALRAARNKPEG